MTVVTTESFVTYTGNGATTLFPFGFMIQTGTDVVTLWSEPTGSVELAPGQYSITGLDNPVGGSVTYPLTGPAISSAYTLTIQRVISPVQQTDISNQANFYPEVIEDALDYLTYMYQQLEFQSDRAVLVPVGDPTPPVLSVGFTGVATDAEAIAKQTSTKGLVPSNLAAIDENNKTRTRYWGDINNGETITTPRVTALRERVFIGAAADYSKPLNLAGHPTFGWLTETTGPNWAARDSSLSVINEEGSFAITGISRTLDKVGAAVPLSTWGLGGIVVNDGAAQFARCLYLEMKRESGASGSPMIEAVALNGGSNVTSSPYGLAASGVDGLWLLASSGSVASYGTTMYGGAVTNPCDTAIVIRSQYTDNDVKGKWNKGIVFDARGLTGTDGVTGVGTAIEMAKGHVITWRSAAGSGASAVLTSGVNTVGQGVQQTFGNNAITFSGADANMLLLTNAASAVNYLTIANRETGVGPGLLATGTDSNIDVRIEPVGTGIVRSNASIKAKLGTAIPAGGTAGAGFMFSSTTNFGVFFGSGAPSLSAAKGSLYLRSDGTSNVTRMYVNTDGSTTWTAVNTVA